MTLGSIIADLADEACVAEALAGLDDLVLLARLRQAADDAGEPLGSFAAGAVGQFMAHAGDAAWLSLISVASQAEDPAAACLRRILAYAVHAPEGRSAPHHH